MPLKIMENGNMQLLVNKTKTSIIGLILVLTISALIVAIPPAIAQKNTFPLLSFSSNPVGVNQAVLIVYGITDATT